MYVLSSVIQKQPTSFVACFDPSVYTTTTEAINERSTLNSCFQMAEFVDFYHMLSNPDRSLQVPKSKRDTLMDRQEK